MFQFPIILHQVVRIVVQLKIRSSEVSCWSISPPHLSHIPLAFVTTCCFNVRWDDGFFLVVLTAPWFREHRLFLKAQAHCLVQAGETSAVE